MRVAPAQVFDERLIHIRFFRIALDNLLVDHCHYVVGVFHLGYCSFVHFGLSLGISGGEKDLTENESESERNRMQGWFHGNRLILTSNDFQLPPRLRNKRVRVSGDFSVALRRAASQSDSKYLMELAISLFR